MLGRLLRYVLGQMDDPAIREELAHPGKAQASRDRLALERADQDGELVAMMPRELPEIHMALMRRQELAEEKAARGHAGSARAGAASRISRRQATKPATDMTRNTT